MAWRAWEEEEGEEEDGAAWKGYGSEEGFTMILRLFALSSAALLYKTEKGEAGKAGKAEKAGKGRVLSSNMSEMGTRPTAPQR